MTKNLNVFKKDMMLDIKKGIMWVYKKDKLKVNSKEKLLDIMKDILLGNNKDKQLDNRKEQLQDFHKVNSKEQKMGIGKDIMLENRLVHKNHNKIPDIILLEKMIIKINASKIITKKMKKIKKMNVQKN